MKHEKLQSLRKNRKKSKSEKLRVALDIIFTLLVLSAMLYMRQEGLYNTIYVVHEYQDNGVVAIAQISHKEYDQRMKDFEITVQQIRETPQIQVNTLTGFNLTASTQPLKIN